MPPTVSSASPGGIRPVTRQSAFHHCFFDDALDCRAFLREGDEAYGPRPEEGGTQILGSYLVDEREVEMVRNFQEGIRSIWSIWR